MQDDLAPAVRQRRIDYIVVSHSEPDHSCMTISCMMCSEGSLWRMLAKSITGASLMPAGLIPDVLELYPDAVVVGWRGYTHRFDLVFVLIHAQEYQSTLNQCACFVRNSQLGNCVPLDMVIRKQMQQTKHG